jgi:hypothetical protein
MCRSCLVMFISAKNYGSDMYPWIFIRDWVEVSVKDMQQGFPGCKFDNYSSYTGQMIRGISDSLMMGPIENGPTSEGLFMPHAWQQFSDCGVNFICGDQISPKLLEGGAVWSWAEGQPEYVSQSGNDGCTFSSRSDGRWSSLDQSSCESGTIMYPVACVSTSSRLNWSVSSQLTTGASAAAPSLCPPGFSFSSPSNGRENSLLIQALQASFEPNSTVSAVWVPWKPIVF